LGDTIRLDVAASSTVMPIVRMIVGGVGARVDLSLDDLEDAYLALEELIYAAEEVGEGPRLTIVVETTDHGISVDTGRFRSEKLRRRLTAGGDLAAGLSLRDVFAQVVESLEVCSVADGCFSVSFTKHRRVG
jgi:hypothetical protein